jgi:very-short-patch-repair endonuclease
MAHGDGSPKSGSSFKSMKSGDREYLTEVSLGQFLRERVDATFVANQPVQGLGRRFRPDYHSERHKLIVEFDGDQHYRSSRVILGDVERDACFTANGFRVIRIPYFVQLSRAVITHLFGDIAHTTNDFLDFPHGFIASTVVMPADFCELGIARFEDDLKRFDYIAGAILKSIREAAATRGDWRTVYPPSRYEKWSVRSGTPAGHLATAGGSAGNLSGT